MFSFQKKRSEEERGGREAEGEVEDREKGRSGKKKGTTHHQPIFALSLMLLSLVSSLHHLCSELCLYGHSLTYIIHQLIPSFLHYIHWQKILVIVS